MKTFAVIPALFVLISLCGSPVPPPPGTVSGTVYFDANRNGIRDTCDSPMRNTQVVVNGPEGATGSVRTGDRGEFTIEDAPVGDGAVTLFTDANHLWPITTAPQAVHVQSSKEVAGVVIGSASRAVYDANIMSISGVIFDDRNANGEVDLDECGISGSNSGLEVRSGDRLAVVGPGGAYELKNLPEGHVLEVTAGPFLGGGSLRPTGGRGDGCATVYTPDARYGPLILEANLGFTSVPGRGSISGVLFDDADTDGELDVGEATLSGVWVRLYMTGKCPLNGIDWGAVTNDDGAFTIRSLYPGTYQPSVDFNPVGENSSIFITMREPLKEITIADDEESLTINLPVKAGPPGSIKVTLFDDNDGNGVWDGSEAAGVGVQACAYQVTPIAGSPNLQYGGYGYGNCNYAGPDGTAVLDMLPEGEYEVSVGAPIGANPSRVRVQVVGGEATEVTVAVDLVTPEEQVIPPGEGEALELNICDSDPSWVQRPFDDGFDSSYSSAYGITREQAQLIYGHGIYVYNGFEMSIWSQLAQAPWRLEKAPPGCGYNYQLLYIFVGYEPLEIVTNGNVMQVRLARRTAGLFVLNLPFNNGVIARTELFVDESYRPIVRCGGDSGCEWNDGSPRYGH